MVQIKNIRLSWIGSNLYAADLVVNGSPTRIEYPSRINYFYDGWFTLVKKFKGKLPISYVLAGCVFSHYGENNITIFRDNDPNWTSVILQEFYDHCARSFKDNMITVNHIQCAIRRVDQYKGHL